MATNHLIRQYDLIPEEILGTPITVIGSGAVGSFTVLTLAKMGFHQIRAMDFDKVSIENMNSQFYRFRDIGRPKVDALREIVQDFTRVKIDAVNGRYEGQSSFPGIVISAVDSMAVRSVIWEAHKGSQETLAFIDPRMGAETALLYTMKPWSEVDQQSYAKSFYSDSNAVQEPCTAKATMYCALSLAALVAKTVKDVAAGQPYCRSATWSVKNSQLTAWVKPWREEILDQQASLAEEASIPRSSEPAAAVPV